jgi:CRP/FNR family transcriptional regulator, cyclic AMP receptor protein
MSSPIESLYIFDGLSKEEVAYFLLMSQTEYYKKWTQILTIGDASNGQAYYINHGRVRVLQGGEEVGTIWPGGFFGEIALITDEPRTATVEAIDDIELQVFMKEDFLLLFKKSEHRKEIQKEIMRRIMERVKK